MQWSNCVLDCSEEAIYMYMIPIIWSEWYMRVGDGDRHTKHEGYSSTEK